MPRILDFTDGFESVSEPSQGSVTSNSLRIFADDTAYETDKGAVGSAGDIYFNTTSGKVRSHNGSAWNDVDPRISSALENHVDDAAFVTANGTAAAGDIYFNTTANEVRRFDGSTWDNVGLAADIPDLLMVELDASGGPTTYNLPSAASFPGRRILLVKTDSSANLASVDRDGTDTIFGSLTTIKLSGINDTVELYSDGTSNWLPGNVDSVYRTLVVRFQGNGTNPPTTSDEIGHWVSSTARNGPGDYTINIVAGIFSSSPHVVIMMERNLDNDRYNLSSWLVGFPSTSAISFRLGITDDVGGTTDTRNTNDDFGDGCIIIRGAR